MAEKRRIYGYDYPVDEEFLESVANMPDCAGAALGFDRLVMLAAGAADIRGTLWSEIPEI
jgi:lysyl-tRNA synthetase class 2